MNTIAGIYTDMAGLRDALRAAVGRPGTTALLPDVAVNAAVARALNKLNSDFPIIGLGTFTTIGGQQSYSPLPAAAHGFRHVFWPRSGGCNSGDYSSLVAELTIYMSGPIDEFGTMVVPDPSMVYDLVRRRTWLSLLADGGYRIVERSVYLDPVPASSGGAVVFSYNADRYATALAVAGPDIDPFLTLCEATIHESLAGGIGGIDQVRDLGEGSDIRTRAPIAHLELAARKRAAYASARPPIELLGIP